MAKKATAKAGRGAGKTLQKSKSSSSDSEMKSSFTQTDVVDALIRLLQSPLVIDLLAVGATAALAEITETRLSRVEGAAGSNKRALKAAGKAAAAAVGRRLSNEIDEIRAASKKAKESRKPKADVAA